MTAAMPAPPLLSASVTTAALASVAKQIDPSNSRLGSSKLFNKRSAMGSLAGKLVD